jgi:hypothetical protein
MYTFAQTAFAVILEALILMWIFNVTGKFIHYHVFHDPIEYAPGVDIVLGFVAWSLTSVMVVFIVRLF